MKTIAQISTAVGSGGIAIIRLSGKDAKQIAFKFFSAKNLTEDNIKPRYLYLGNFKAKSFDEKCLLVYFKAPFSFTGEDVVEFQIHGGELLASKILENLLSDGAILAENGEFTKQAFLNGKITLNQAESMIDLINATSEAELKVNSHKTSSLFNTKIKEYQEILKQALVDLAVSIDYPEYDEEFIETSKVEKILNNLKTQIKMLVKNFDNTAKIKSGVNVSIIGKPNVGKSSLLNNLIGEEIAIVTDIKGTTRDIIKETIVYKGLKINFIDTAGIRESSDIVEKIGIEKSKKSVESSDIVICVLDASENLAKEDDSILKLCEDKKFIKVYNKCDKKKVLKTTDGIEISALKNDNIESIKQQILKLVKLEKIDFSQVVITNNRHYSTLIECLNLIDSALNACKNNMVDIIESSLKFVWKCLGKITGESESEKIIDEIFKKFCLGK